MVVYDGRYTKLIKFVTEMMLVDSGFSDSAR